MTYHQTVVVGNLGGDPEMRYLPSGTAVCNFNVAVSERWTDKSTGERQERTYWYRVAAFGSLAEICNQYLEKGRQVLVTGTVTASAYMGNDGQPKASLELKAQEVKFLGGGSETSEGSVTSGNNPQVKIVPKPSEDIPF